MTPTVTSNPAQVLRVSKPRTTPEQRQLTMEIDRLRGAIITRQAFRDAEPKDSEAWRKHEAAIADYERKISKLQGGNNG